MPTFNGLNAGPVVLIGTATDGPFEPTKVTFDSTSDYYFRNVYGKIPIKPNEIYDESDKRIFNRNLTKTLYEFEKYGGAELPVITIRVGNPSNSSLELFEDPSGTGSNAPTYTGTGDPVNSIIVKSRFKGDEYNAFFVTVSLNSNSQRTITLSYDPNSVIDDYATFNAIDDDDIYTNYSLVINNIPLDKVVNKLNNTAFGRYLKFEVSYIENTYIVDVDRDEETITFPVGEPYSYDLYKIDSITVEANVVEIINKGYQDHLLALRPDKSLDYGTKTISDIFINNNVVTISKSDFTYNESNGMYEAKVDVIDKYNGSDMVCSSVKDSVGVNVSYYVNRNVLLIPSKYFKFASGDIVVKYKYSIGLAEAKTAERLATGSWANFFVTGRRIEFGDQLPYDLEVHYSSSSNLTVDVDYTIESYGKTKVSTYRENLLANDIISIKINYDSEALKLIDDGELKIHYLYYPEFPATTDTTSGGNTQIAMLSGATDGSDMDEFEYRTAIEKALGYASNYGPSDVIICGIYYDSYIERFATDAVGNRVIIKEWMDYISLLDRWIKNQSENINHCRAYISGQGIVWTGDESDTKDINEYINRHLKLTSNYDVNPYKVRASFNNFMLRFVMGDAHTHIADVGDGYFPTNLAVVSLLGTRLRENTQSKLGFKLENLSQGVRIKSRLAITDRELKRLLSKIGWEIYTAVPEVDSRFGITCISERSGAKSGTRLDKQYMVDSLFLVLKTARYEMKKFIGKPATETRLNSIKERVMKEILSAYYPNLIRGVSINYSPRGTTEIINENMKYEIRVRINGYDGIISFEDTVGA